MRSASAENLWSMRETRLVPLEVAPMLQVAPQQADLLDKIGQEGRQLAIHACVAPAVETAWLGWETMR